MQRLEPLLQDVASKTSPKAKYVAFRHAIIQALEKLRPLNSSQIDVETHLHAMINKKRVEDLLEKAENLGGIQKEVDHFTSTKFQRPGKSQISEPTLKEIKVRLQNLKIQEQKLCDVVRSELAELDFSSSISGILPYLSTKGEETSNPKEKFAHPGLSKRSTSASTAAARWAAARGDAAGKTPWCDVGGCCDGAYACGCGYLQKKIRYDSATCESDCGSYYAANCQHRRRGRRASDSADLCLL